MTSTGTRPRRRTQAERRAATQTALLDATISCLVEHGYEGTTTPRVVDRAGVSRGAQVHHFPTKDLLIAEAAGHLAQRRLDELSGVLPRLRRGHGRVADVLDVVWRSYTSPLFAAWLELWVAARTDAELRKSMVAAEREVTASTRKFLRDALDTEAAATDDEALDFLVAQIAGVALQTSLSSRRAASAAWGSARARLVDLAKPGA